MFIVTNRVVKPSAEGVKKLGSTPSPKGPNELRLVEAQKNGSSWAIKILPDIATASMREAAAIPKSLSTAYASDYAARLIFNKVREEKRNILFFVHGYNNDVQAVLERAALLEELYNVEVLAFSWPANGGGVSGVASYKSDQRDARASAGGLDRCIGRMAALISQLTEEERKSIENRVKRKYARLKDAEKIKALTIELQERLCTISINMISHSMGNYLYKHSLLPTSSYGQSTMIFDNVILASADINNENHAEWVDRIPCRKSVYIAINENDAALALSRAKIGEDQLPRLGHYRHKLEAVRAIYLDYTDAALVERSHAYFEGEPIGNKSGNVYKTFNDILNGRRPVSNLIYDNGLRAYKVT